jgi:L-amino acid N-acyltransferase YncA
VTLRPITPDDHAAAAAVYNHYVTTSTATFQTEPVSPEEWAAESLAGEAGRHGAWTVLDDGGGAAGAFAGYLLVQPFKSRCAYRDTAEVTVYLTPGSTGRGLGGAALDHAEAHARAAGLHALLAVVCAENDASLAAFERHGYDRVALLKEVGTKFGRRLDVVYLEKVVGPPSSRAES